MAVIKGIQASAAAPVPAAPEMLLVRLKSRSYLEPGCIQVEAGHIMSIPAAHFDAQYHELVNPPALAPAPVDGPPAEGGSQQASAVSQADLDDIHLFEDPK